MKYYTFLNHLYATEEEARQHVPATPLGKAVMVTVDADLASLQPQPKAMRCCRPDGLCDEA
mgnify:CR=1 FL=1